MIGKNAFHLLGDISRSSGDICLVDGETPDFFIGSWITGYGFFDVLFPKKTTRDLTDQEVRKWNKRGIQIGGGPVIKLNIKRRL